MQESSHHGKIIREYRELRTGLSQEDLGRRIGKSRRTIITIEQNAHIKDVKLRRTLAWTLQIPPELLGLPETDLADIAILYPLDDIPSSTSKPFNREVIETLTENLSIRLDLYYLGSALAADKNLNEQIKRLEQMLQGCSSTDRYTLLTLLSHNYQLKGLIARDQVDYVNAVKCFKHASLLAQKAECLELHALSMARLAVVHFIQRQLDTATLLYETARDVSKHSPVALRAYLAVGHAEVQGKLGDQSCLTSLSQARSLLKRIDPEDDYLMLHHSTRCSEHSIDDGWAQCHTLIGKPELAIEYYDNLERKLDLSMTRMRSRLYIQYAEALYTNKDMSCCFYAIEGLKFARSVGSESNIRRTKELALKLRSLSPHDRRVQELLQTMQN